MSDWSRLKVFAEDILNMAEMIVNICETLEKALQHFLLLPQGFQRAFFNSIVKLGILLYKSNYIKIEIHLKIKKRTTQRSASEYPMYIITL